MAISRGAESFDAPQWIDELSLFGDVNQMR
jgi:hypothetical protein